MSASGPTDLALGSDPFALLAEPDPFLEGLAVLAARPARARPRLVEADARTPSLEALLAELAPPAPAAPAPRLSTTPATPPATPLHARRTTRTPPLSEVEVPEVESWIDRLLSDADRQRLAALAHLVGNDTGYDRFGLSTEVLKQVFPLFHALYHYYFRVESIGREHVPAVGPVVVASNHAGLLPFDASMLVADILLGTDPPRLARTIVDRWAGELPWVNVFFARIGQIIGTHESFSELLADGQLVLVLPEGMAGAIKPITQRYRLQSFHVGFVAHALRARAPIVPAAVIGSDDQAPVLFDLAGLARRFGLPTLPITPTFPWLGPLGLLPYPVRYRIVYGEPIALHERYGPEAADDPRLVRSLAGQVRHAVQGLVDRHR